MARPYMQGNLLSRSSKVGIDAIDAPSRIRVDLSWPFLFLRTKGVEGARMPFYVLCRREKQGQQTDREDLLNKAIKDEKEDQTRSFLASGRQGQGQGQGKDEDNTLARSRVRSLDVQSDNDNKHENATPETRQTAKSSRLPRKRSNVM